jgi:hypothetical protein
MKYELMVEVLKPIALVAMMAVVFLVVSTESYEKEIATLNIEHTEELAIRQDEIAELNKIILENTNYKVKVTYYVPSLGGINAQGDPNKTAVMEKPVPGKTIAVSRDLAHLLYKKIYVLNRGVFYANDLLADENPYTGQKIRKQIDICVGSTKDIPRQGVFKNIPIAVKT